MFPLHSLSHGEPGEISEHLVIWSCAHSGAQLIPGVVIILMHLSGMKRNENIYKAFAITVCIRGKGTSSKSVAAKKEEIHARASQ